MIRVLPLLLAPSLALANPCEHASDGMIIGPVGAPIRDGGLGNPRRTCVRQEFGAAIDGRATVDLANFYGYLTGGLDLDVSWSFADRYEVFARIEAVRFDMAIASLSDNNLGLGHLTIGAGMAQALNDEAALGARVRVMLPTATGLYANARPLGLDVAVSTVWTPLPWLRVHDEIGGLAIFTLGREAAATRAGAWANLGVELLVHRNFGLVVDVDGGFALDAPLDYLDAGVGLRFSDGKRFGFEFGGRVPVAGRGLELARIGIRGSVRFGPVSDGARAVARLAPRVDPGDRLVGQP
jgi:hypothetical protein